MTGYFISLSLLIAVLLLIRGLFRKAISPRVMYSLWLVVIFRMIFPFALVEINLPWPEYAQTEDALPEETLPPAPETIPIEQEEITSPSIILPPVSAQPVTPSVPTDTGYAPVTPINPGPNASEPVPESPVPTQPEQEEELPPPAAFDWLRTARLIWAGGSAVMALFFALSGGIFHHRLRADRKLLRTIRRTRVYLSANAGAPCLAGLIPAIYITPDALAGKGQTMILIHEYTHLRHGDHLWSFVRILALIAHWWNPLVWAAAFASKQDAELACDDAIASRLNDEQRLAYAHILLDTAPQKRSYAVGLGSAPLKERILLLAQKRKTRWICLILAVVLALTAVCVSFLGRPRLTQENILAQKGFTILSQEEKLVALTFPADSLPAYEDISAAGSGGISLNGLPVFSEGATTITAETIRRSGNGKSIAIGLLTRYDPEEEGSLISLYRVVNDADEVRFSTGEALPHSLQDESGEYRNAFDGLEYGYPDDGIIRVLVKIESYRQLNGEAVITLPLNEITYCRGSEVKRYADQDRSLPPDDPAEEVPLHALEVDRLTLTQVESFPEHPADPLLEAYPMGGIPTFALFSEGMEFYIRNYRNINEEADYYCGQLPLPQGFTDGSIIFMSSGAGSGELFLYVEAIRDWQREYLSYYFVGINLQAVFLMDEQDQRFLREQMSYHPLHRDIYLCDDVYYNKGIQGSATILLPTALTEYRVTDCKILRCTDLCDPTAVLSRAVWGYAPGWTIDRYEEFTTKDGWTYDTRRYSNEIPEDIREQMRQSGAPEEVLYPNNYLYLLSLDDNHYAYLCLEPKGDLPGGDAEADLHNINEIVKAAKIKLVLDDETAANTFQGGAVGYLEEDDADEIQLYTRRGGDYLLSIPRTIIKDFLAPDWEAGWMNLYFYTGSIGSFRWVIVCSGTAMGSGTMNCCTSADGGKTWTIHESSRFTGAVTGALFVSEQVGYISHQYFNDNGPSISQTTDGGKTWQRLALTIPERLQSYKMVPGTPFKEQDTWLYPIALHTDRGAEDETYLLSDDGLNWRWDVWATRPLQQTSYFVDVPLDEEKREYLSNAAAYGISTGYAPSGEIWAGEDGVRWEVLGIGSHFKRGGVYSGFHTYRVESKDGYIVSVEEAQTFTKELVKANGTPYTGPLDGMYTVKAYNAGNGLLSRAIYVNGSKIDVACHLDGTDAGGTYSGEINGFDSKTGLLTAVVTSRTVSNNGEITVSQPLRFSGYLLEYGGFVHFLCESSQTGTLSPDDPLPLTFLPNTDGAQNAPAVRLDDNFSGDWIYTFSDETGSQFYHLRLDPESASIQFDYGYAESEYVNRYTGSYTVNPLTYEATAVMRDADSGHTDREITLGLYLGYSIGENGKFLSFSPTSSSVGRYQHLIGKDLFFSPGQPHSQTSAMLDPILDGGWIHEFTAESGEKGFYSLVLDTENSRMQFDCGWRESEYDNRYIGSYTFDPETNRITAHLRDTTADVSDPDRMVRANPEITLVFTLSRWNAGPDATMKCTIYSCTVERYHHLVGQSLLFSRQGNDPVQPTTVAIRTLDQLKDCADRGYISNSLYNFYWNLLSGQSDIPEYRSLVITDVTILFTHPLTEYRTDFSFTVEKSDIPALPVGQHQRIVYDIREPTMVDPAADRADPYADVEEVKKLYAFISGSYIWNTPTYGQGANYPGMHNYICNYHGGEDSTLPLEEYKEIARAEFGVTDFDALVLEGLTLPGGYVQAGGIGGNWAGRVVDVFRGSGVTEEGGMTGSTGYTGDVRVTMQFYGDNNCLLPSHKIAYRFSHDGRWLGYQILTRGNYEPYGLQYIGEDAVGYTNTIIEAYRAASEAASWFRIASLLEQPAEGATVDTSNPVIQDDMHYFPVAQFASYNAFTDHLLTLFSQELLDWLMENNHTYINHNGKLYASFGLRGTNPRMGEETYAVSKISDTHYQLTVTVDVMDQEEDAIFLFPYQFIDGRWVFTDFPEIR